MKNCYFIYFSIILVSLACHSKDGSHKDVEHQKHKQEHAHKGNEINHHMHETPIEELINRFESPDRDAYQQPEKVLDYIGDISGQTILDIGAGSGYFSFKMLKRGAVVIAGDVEDGFLKYMQERVEKEQMDTSNIEIRKLPYDSPSLKQEEINKAIIVNTYHHIEERSDYFAKVLKGLKQGGELIVIDFFKKELPIGPGVDHKFSEKEVVTELKKAGFNNFEINSDLLEMQYIIRAKQ